MTGRSTGTIRGMLQQPVIDPVALQLGPLAIHWYGLTYLAAFGLFYFLGTRRLTHLPFSRLPQWSRKDIEDILFLGVLGVVLGGRIGYCLFYKPAYYATHPLEVFAVWQGGMSFHGGMLGVMAAMVWFAHSRQRPFLQVMDFVAPCVPTGLAAGRVGNFINGELWGRVADPGLPWGMVFRGAGDLPRHPSQVYQFLMEGLLLFVLLWFYARKPRAQGQVSAMFLIGYGVFRFIAEFFREPDSFLGLRALNLAENACHTMHNLCPLRGAKTRDSLAWAHYLNQALDGFVPQVDALVVQHHWPVWGNARALDYLKAQRDTYRYIHDQTLRLANLGLTSQEIAEELRGKLAGEAKIEIEARGEVLHVVHRVDLEPGVIARVGERLAGVGVEQHQRGRLDCRAVRTEGLGHSRLGPHRGCRRRRHRSHRSGRAGRRCAG